MVRENVPAFSQKVAVRVADRITSKFHRFRYQAYVVQETVYGYAKLLHYSSGEIAAKSTMKADWKTREWGDLRFQNIVF